MGARKPARGKRAEYRNIISYGLLYEVGLYITDRKWQVVQSEINFDVDPDDPFAVVRPAEDIPIEEEELVESIA